MRRSAWQDWADETSAAIRAAGQWRQPRDLDAAGPEGKLEPDGRPVVSFASNDYLGLSQHPRVIAAARAALDRWGTGSGSARLIVGSRPIHTELESALAEWKRAEHAVLFPTGFAANLGVLSTFGGRDVLICSDELNHASIIDGCRMSRSEVAVYRHADAAHVDAMLRACAGSGRRAIVVTDTVFSMDGDCAPVGELAQLCARRGALLVLDEAHAVLGPDPDLDGPRWGRRAPRRHAVEDARLTRRLRRGAGGAHAADRQPRPLLHLHDGTDARRHRGRARGAGHRPFRRGNGATGAPACTRRPDPARPPVADRPGDVRQ